MAADKSKILVVEDDKFLIKAYQEKLTREGFDVALAFDGGEALKQYKAQKPEVILLDLVMPFMDGFTFLEELAKMTDVKKAKVIVLSNLGQPEDIERAKKLGAVDYMVKSDLSMKEVVDKINGWLKK